MTSSQLLPIANHLWQSTLFAAVAGLLTLTLRSNRAVMRYWLWVAASVKFLIPFSPLVMMGHEFGRHTTIPVMPFGLSYVVDEVGEPFASSVPLRAIPAAEHTWATLVPSVVCGMWAIGFVFLVFSWWRRWRALRAAIRNASPLDLPITFHAVTSPAFPEPSVFGIRQPVLLLPDGITDQLTPPQLEAILAHELCHVRRRDNLAAAIHMAVEAVFWFHPMVWWLGARLMEERELACDEEVLRMGREPEVYAEGILKICEVYLKSALECVAGVAGANLNKRIHAIMTNRIPLRLNFGRKVVLALAGIAAIAVPIVTGVLNPPTIRAQSAGAGAPIISSAAQALAEEPSAPLRSAEPRAEQPQVLLAQNKSGPETKTLAPAEQFEVASVKPSAPVPPNGGVYFGPPRGGPGTRDPEQTTWSYATLKGMLMKAYDVKAYQVSGPKWLETERYDIVAKVPAGVTKEQVNRMWQNLIGERFGVMLHHEAKEFQVYELIIAKGGPKLKESVEDDANAEGPPKMDKDGKLSGPGMVNLITHGSNGISVHSMVKAQPLARLTVMLGNQLNRPVIDKTGLNGQYDFDLEFAPDPTSFPPPPTPGSTDNTIERGPDLITALQMQLGLKVVPSKANLDVLVVDKAEKVPTAN
jgi:bla regulator protein BlaR1